MVVFQITQKKSQKSLIYSFQPYNVSDKLKAENPSTADPDLTLLNNHVNSKVPANTKFNIPLMNLTDLVSSIKSLDPTKATGLDGISPKVLLQLILQIKIKRKWKPIFKMEQQNTCIGAAQMTCTFTYEKHHP